METLIEKDLYIITIELANAIASFKIVKVTELLSVDGGYCLQDEKEETVVANKSSFIKWLSNCIEEFFNVNEDLTQLNYIIDRCSYCRIGNPVIIFENSRFPVMTRNPWESSKCELMLEFKDNLVSDISFCYIFLSSENPYNYEKKCKRHLD